MKTALIGRFGAALLPIVLAAAVPATAGEPEGAAAPADVPAFMANRFGEARKKAVLQNGGSEATERAVEAALKWLARHQEPDGHWDCAKHEVSSPLSGSDIGLTGLALLAFMGAGHTEKAGAFADNAKRAREWLMKRQRPEGYFGLAGEPMSRGLSYGHAMTGMALAEAYALGRDAAVGQAAQRAADYSTGRHQCPDSGWRYMERQPADTSVTGWYVMQLKTSKAVGFKVDEAGFSGAAKFLDNVTAPEGTVGYAAPRVDSGIGMVAVGMVMRQSMGASKNDPNLVKGTALLMANLPSWPAPVRKGHYYWYYGTQAMFQMGGDNWKRWNEALKPVLVNNQRKGGPPDGSKDDVDGSWDFTQADPYDARGGRIYTTVLGALTLETYYRYAPLYRADGSRTDGSKSPGPQPDPNDF